MNVQNHNGNWTSSVDATCEPPQEQKWSHWEVMLNPPLIKSNYRVLAVAEQLPGTGLFFRWRNKTPETLRHRCWAAGTHVGQPHPHPTPASKPLGASGTLCIRLCPGPSGRGAGEGGLALGHGWGLCVCRRIRKSPGCWGGAGARMREDSSHRRVGEEHAGALNPASTSHHEQPMSPFTHCGVDAYPDDLTWLWKTRGWSLTALRTAA